MREMGPVCGVREDGATDALWSSSRLKIWRLKINFADSLENACLDVPSLFSGRRYKAE